MCVIIYLPKNTKISKQDLIDAFDYNDDGAGIAWVKDGKVHYSKGYVKFNSFYKNTKSIINDTSIDRVIHFRITSRGTTNPFQTHPFQYTDDVEKTKDLDYIGTDPVLFANGTIVGQKLIDGLNDTASFIVNDLYNSSLSFNNETDLKIIDKLTTCKWAVVETTGVTLIGDFDLVDGVYYSNLYHTYFRSYTSRSFKKSWYDDVVDDAIDDEVSSTVDKVIDGFDYDVCYDDCFYTDYSLNDLLDGSDAPLLVEGENKSSQYDKCKDCVSSNCDNCTCNDCGYADKVASDFIDTEYFCGSDANISDVSYFSKSDKGDKSLSDLFPNKPSKDLQNIDLDDAVTGNAKFRDWFDSNLKSLKTLCGLDD